MNKQVWYESARESVDDVVDRHFRSLRPEGHRLLARVWQYLRDQEVVAIQSAMKAERIVKAQPRRLSVPAVAMAGFGGAD